METLGLNTPTPEIIPAFIYDRMTDYAPELPPVIKDVKGKKIKYRGRTQIRPENCTISYTDAMIEEVKRCKRDIEYFAENYFYIISKDEGKKLIELYPKQYEMLRHMHENRFTATLASRQIGKTTLVSIILLHQAMFNDDFTIGVLSNKEKGAKDVIRRIKVAYKELPHWLKQGVTEWNTLSIVFENGSRIEAEATSEDSFTGRSLNILFVDEVAKIAKNLWDEFWNSAYPTISSGTTTKVLMVSTPKGLNHWYKICHDSLKELSPFKFFRYDWWEVPGRDLKWKQDQIATIYERGFAQEYGCEFLGSGNTLLSGDALKSLVWHTPISVKDDYHFKVYENPSPNRVYVIGVDTGKGVELCYSVAQVLDITEFPIRQVAVFRAADILYSDFPGYIMHIADEYFNPIIMVENNDLGQSVADALFFDYEYDNLYSEFKKPNMGLRTTTKTKRIMLHFMRDLIETQKMIVNDYDTIAEFGTFIKKANSYVPEEGSTADAIMALAVGAYVLKTDWVDVDRLTQKIARVVYVNPEMEETPFPILPSGSYEDTETDDDFKRWLIS